MQYGQFPSTRHSILDLAAGTPAPARERALNQVLEAYWKPAFHYIRTRWRASGEDAEDLTQSFFSSLVERGLLSSYDPGRAAFRTYLRTCIDGHVKNARSAAHAAKRGGGAPHVPLDFDPAGEEDPEACFYREWQRQMFSLAIEDLKRHCIETDRESRWTVFSSYDLAENGRPSYEDLAGTLNIPVTKVTNQLAWARRELRRLLLERLRGVTATDREMDREAEGLFR